MTPAPIDEQRGPEAPGLDPVGDATTATHAAARVEEDEVDLGREIAAEEPEWLRNLGLTDRGKREIAAEIAASPSLRELVEKLVEGAEAEYKAYRAPGGRFFGRRHEAQGAIPVDYDSSERKRLLDQFLETGELTPFTRLSERLFNTNPNNPKMIILFDILRRLAQDGGKSAPSLSPEFFDADFPNRSIVIE